MSKILCFGELLLRYSPDESGNWIRNQSMPVFIGGAELNVARSLALWNAPTAYLTQIPDNYISHHIIDFLSTKNIDMSRTSLAGNKLGAYYLKQSSDLKNKSTIYDRKDSAFSQLKTGQIDWEKIFDNIHWLHFSAIIPALNANMAAVCAEAIAVANKKNITVSIDLNYRESLWNWGTSPIDVMPELVKGCHVVMGNIWSIEKMLGLPTNTKDIAQAEITSRALMKQFPGCRQVANTFRMDMNNHTDYYATLFDGENVFVSNEYKTNKVIDRVGSGDSFMAGLIYGNDKQWPAADIINFAAAAGFSKLFVKGDVNTTPLTSILNSSHVV
jgi:2-dehydro-3-deoxygluconokinase